MGRIRSILETCRVDQAKKAHNCQANAQHRIKNGDTRLKVRNGRSWDHYCVECGREIVRKGLDRLSALAEELVDKGEQKSGAGVAAASGPDAAGS
jgi:hypothetical protein